MPSHSAAERAALTEALIEAGPHGPTLCDGWTTTELAVHLVVRERRSDLRLAARIPGLSALGRRGLDAYAARPYAELVELVRTGPPLTSPLALPGADARINLAEHFIHGEDVRRARPGWEPRELPAARQAAFWKVITTMGRLMLRASPVPVLLRTPDGRTHAVGTKDAGPGVELIGEPGEILMYVSGRKDHARVQLEGPDDAVTAFRSVRFAA